MKTILQAHAAIETLAGFLLLFNPHWLLANQDPHLQGIAIAKLYGILALSFGLISYILSNHFRYDLMYKQVNLIIISFHFAVGLYMYGLYSQNLTQHPGASILHLGLAIVFMIIYLKNMQKFPQKNESIT